MNTKKQLPKEIIVHLQNEGTDDEFFEVHQHIDEVAEIGQRTKVGRYVLKEVLTITAESKIL